MSVTERGREGKRKYENRIHAMGLNFFIRRKKFIRPAY